MSEDKHRVWARNGWEGVHIQRSEEDDRPLSVVQRMTVPGGWLVRCIGIESRTTSVTYVPDPDAWAGRLADALHDAAAARP